MMGRPLYIPVNVEALVVGEPSCNPPYVDMTPDFNLLTKERPFGDKVVNDPFSTQSARPGIHLHWSLPDALLKGIQGDDEIEFPCVPNKWVIQRLAVHNQSIVRKAWVLTSNFITNREARVKTGIWKTSMPTFVYDEKTGLWNPGKNGTFYSYMGDIRDESEDCPGDGVYLDKLTAAGYGDPVFAAFYPQCKTVFGFYDPMDDSPHGRYTYLVAGYYDYADPKRDPLYQVNQDILEKLLWTYDDSDLLPDRSICHGCIRGVLWEGADKPYETSVPDGKIEVAIANTSAEALSALLQLKMPNVGGLERMLNALQYNFLNDLDCPDYSDALIRFEEMLHGKQFNSNEGGHRWTLRFTDPKKDRSRIELDKDQYNQLDLLNRTQTLWDQCNGNLVSLQNEFYSAWYKYVTLSSPPRPSPKAGEFLALAQSTLERIVVTQRQMCEYAALIAPISTSLSTSLKSAGMEVVKSPAPRYYSPAPPALLLYGKGVGRSFRQGFQSDGDGRLPCRMTTISSLGISIDGVPVKITGNDLFPASSPAVLPIGLVDLFYETILLSEDVAETLALIALAKIGISEVKSRLTKTTAAVRESQIRLSGRPFHIADTEWKQPWNPVMMAWQIKVTPSRTNCFQDDSFNPFSLGELDLEPEESLFSGKPFTVKGTTILTPHAANHMHTMLMKLIDDYAEDGIDIDTLKKVGEMLQKANLLSQQLGGFHQALLMKKQTPILPLVSPSSKTNDLISQMNKVMQDIPFVPQPGLDTDGFLPVAAGSIRIEQLRLIDSFGQFRDIHVSEGTLITSESMASALKNEALLRPRFLQPCRLSFDWISHRHAGIKSSYDSGSTPVFGFIVANFLDINLQVHDEHGEILGTLQHTDEGTRWFDSPGTFGGSGSIPNDHLRYFVEGLLRTNTPLTHLLDYFDGCFNSNSPWSPETFLQNCFGQVIALCRASVNVSAQGLFNTSQTFDIQSKTNDYEQEQFPIAIGDLRKIQNGVLGFFQGECEPHTYDTFHLCCRKQRSAEGYIMQDNTVLMSLNAPPVPLTLLLIPSGSISVTTGFLPSETYTLAKELYISQLETMTMRFKLYPVLGDDSAFAVPLPGSPDQQWEFTNIERDGSARTIRDIQTVTPHIPDRRQQALEGLMSIHVNTNPTKS